MQTEVDSLREKMRSIDKNRKPNECFGLIKQELENLDVQSDGMRYRDKKRVVIRFLEETRGLEESSDWEKEMMNIKARFNIKGLGFQKNGQLFGAFMGKREILLKMG